MQVGVHLRVCSSRRYQYLRDLHDRGRNPRDSINHVKTYYLVDPKVNQWGQAWPTVKFVAFNAENSGHHARIS